MGPRWNGLYAATRPHPIGGRGSESPLYVATTQRHRILAGFRAGSGARRPPSIRRAERSGTTMMLKSVSRILMTMLVVLLWQWLAGVTAESAYSRIVAFGDSLADPGNAFTLLQISAVPP